MPEFVVKHFPVKRYPAKSKLWKQNVKNFNDGIFLQVTADDNGDTWGALQLRTDVVTDTAAIDVSGTLMILRCCL